MFAQTVLFAFGLLQAQPEIGIDAENLLSLPARERPAGPRPSAKNYAAARAALARGNAQLALKLLKQTPNVWLEDREALIRGEAQLALNQKAEALASYRLAFERAQVPSIRIKSALQLARLHHRLGNYVEELILLDALLAQKYPPGRADLGYARAVALIALGRLEEASSACFALLQQFPAHRITRPVEALLADLKKKKVPAPVSTPELELSRVQRLIKAGEEREAERALDRLAASAPQLSIAIALTRADLYRSLRQHDDERGLLERLSKSELGRREGPKVFERLGRIMMSKNDNQQAQSYFDQLAQRYPHSRLAAETQFLCAWLPYNAGNYAEATERFLLFAGEYRRYSRRPEALWFAGWSAYLGGELQLSRRALNQLLEEHASSEMAIWAHYWNGRIREQNKDSTGAREAYRNVLKIAPMSYFGSWSIGRLADLGERVVLSAPEDKQHARLGEVLALLGDARPQQVDRAIMLREVGLENDSLEELEAASRQLASVRDNRGRVMIAEMLESLGAHHQAFSVANKVIEDGDDLIGGKPYAWRAWRLAYPKAFVKEVEVAAKAHDVDPLLILSIMRTESHFRPGAKSIVGARGLMQLMPQTARRIGERTPSARAHSARYTEPESNIWLGAWYLRQLLDRFGGQIALAAGAYNAGPGAMDRWLRDYPTLELDAFVETVTYRETRRYMRRVVETYQIYRRLDGLEPIDLTNVVPAQTVGDGSIDF